jgi:hypothetical protein
MTTTIDEAIVMANVVLGIAALSVGFTLMLLCVYGSLSARTTEYLNKKVGPSVRLPVLLLCTTE